MDTLEKIIEAKRARVAIAKARIPRAQVVRKGTDLRQLARPHAFVKALDSDEPIKIIAEFKRQSPSKGVIRGDVGPAEMTRQYEGAGATAISVLTEEDYFAGSLADLAAVREAVSLPILCKDFIFDEYQVFEAAAAGADALLLIVACLDDAELRRLRTIAEVELEMDALVEVHNEEEIKRAVDTGARLIGVNNRDLRTFAVSIETSVRLRAMAPDDAVLISESGLNTSDELKRLRELGYRGFLVGEALMRARSPADQLRALLR